MAYVPKRALLPEPKPSRRSKPAGATAVTPATPVKPFWGTRKLTLCLYAFGIGMILATWIGEHRDRFPEFAHPAPVTTTVYPEADVTATVTSKPKAPATATVTVTAPTSPAATTTLALPIQTRGFRCQSLNDQAISDSGQRLICEADEDDTYRWAKMKT